MAIPLYRQLEITTRCNFSCLYCAGRVMPQRDMSWDVFVNIIDSIPPVRGTVSLQGEGEPTLHPKFWEMVEYVSRAGHVPYSIINGSRVDVERMAYWFPRLAISIDSFDEDFSRKIGRVNPEKVLHNFMALLRVMGPERLVVMTVDMGQPLDDLIDFLKKHSIRRHIIQPLMRKVDYAVNYSDGFLRRSTDFSIQSYMGRGKSCTCRYLYQDSMRYYNWEGLALPCCFIKDTRGIDSIDGLRRDMESGIVPFGCMGCRELVYKTSQNPVAL